MEACGCYTMTFQEADELAQKMLEDDDVVVDANCGNVIVRDGNWQFVRDFSDIINEAGIFTEPVIYSVFSATGYQYFDSWAEIVILWKRM